MTPSTHSITLRGSALLAALLAATSTASALTSSSSSSSSSSIYTPQPDGSFTLGNGSFFHNRPLYGAHNSMLVLAGDRPIVHLCEDKVLFGGLLMGLVSGSTGVWAHNADDISAAFVPGSFQWQVSDSSLPGLSLSARILPVSEGQGAVVDVNVTSQPGAPAPAEFVWAFGCGTTPAAGNNLGWLYDPLLHPEVLTWDFSPEDCVDNRVVIDTATNSTFNISFGSTVVTVNVATSSPGPSSLAAANASDWQDIVGLGAPPRSGSGKTSGKPAGGGYAAGGSRGLVSALPVPGATFWLRAPSLAGNITNGSSVPAWGDESGSGAVVVQQDAARMPVFLSDGIAPGEPGVLFDGIQTFLASPNVAVGNESTMMAVFRDEGSTGGDNPCCSGLLFFEGAFQGLSTRSATGPADDDDGNEAPGEPVVMTLDYAGSATYGRLNVRGRTVVTSSTYTAAGPSTFAVDGCSQGSAAIGGQAGLGVMVGTRNNELGRFFKGLIGEIVVFPRALDAQEMSEMLTYFASAWPSTPPKRECVPPGTLPVSRTALPQGPAATTTRFTISIVASAAASDPLEQLASANQRVAALTSMSAVTPDPIVNGALKAMGAAVDGLFRDSPSMFVHGAMAWDVPYVGWRSECGATVFGRSSLVAAEGVYLFATQDTTSPRDAPCVTDPSHKMTVEAQNSRFYGRGRITAFQGMYDMQSQMMDQQVHMWRWTANATHEAMLRPALALHLELAEDAYDHDGDALYAAYINTWPTDSVWYNGGATAEETAYVYTAARALRDMATRAGNATEAGMYAALMAKIEQNLPLLWISDEGHYAAFREEGGHMRLRPDAWLYAVFLPIEAGLNTPEEAAQALYYSEWALERDVVECPVPGSPGGVNETCGVVVWTSNWVPSQWSVRQLWGGDNYALAMAYFFAGLPDDGYAVLRGTLSWNMLLMGVPGQAGGANGGTDFNDCVHPLSRALVEGLFGYRPDYISGTVLVAPQFPSAWANASLAVADVQLAFSSPAGSAGTSSLLAVTLTQPVPSLVLKLPVRAAGLATGGGVSVTGLVPPSATWTVATEPGFGQSVVVVTVQDAGGVTAARVTVSFDSPLPYTPSVYVNLTEGQAGDVTLVPPQGLVIVNMSDPQGVFAPGSARIVNGSIVGSLASGVSGYHMVIASASTVATPGGQPLPQTILFKLNITAADAGALPLALRFDPAALSSSPASQWTFISIEANADITGIYLPGQYLSPRPETCAVRVGTDGWSAWTFTYWNSPAPPTPDFAFLANFSIGGGVIQTPQGARFLLPNSTAAPGRGELGPGARAAPGGSGPNIAFASLWDNYPAAVNVSVAPGALPGATTAWVLVAGSTNPMQTLLANAALRFAYTDGTVEELDLVPPRNFWSLSGWGTADYDYETDAFCLPQVPPPSVQLGNSNRAMVYAHSLAEGKTLAQVQLEVLSQEVVIGVMAVSLMA
jgi:hypothetical protein